MRLSALRLLTFQSLKFLPAPLLNPVRLVTSRYPHCCIGTDNNHILGLPDPMASYKTFAVVGAGGLGSFLVDELLKRQASVKILTRDSTKVPLQLIACLLVVSPLTVALSVYPRACSRSSRPSRIVAPRLPRWTTPRPSRSRRPSRASTSCECRPYRVHAVIIIPPRGCGRRSSCTR